MAKKAERTLKPVKKTDRWTVRGVPTKLQKAAGDAARAKGMTLGQWLSQVLGSSLPRRGVAPAETTQRWEEAVEQRLARLEAVVLVSERAATGVSAEAWDRALSEKEQGRWPSMSFTPSCRASSSWLAAGASARRSCP
jgi:hypothetical protein